MKSELNKWVRVYVAAVVVMVFGIVVAGKSFAADAGGDAQSSITLAIKDHVFVPSTIEAPADKKITLHIENKDTTPEEFESHDLKREKVIPAGGKVKVVVGPLKPGTYSFVGEYHESTAKGVLVVK